MDNSINSIASATGILGDNKITVVLKLEESHMNNLEYSLHISGLEFEKQELETNLYYYIQKLVKNNIAFVNDGKETNNSNKKYLYSLYINIVNAGGNLYDCISRTLSNFFEDNSRNQTFITKNIVKIITI